VKRKRGIQRGRQPKTKGGCLTHLVGDGYKSKSNRGQQEGKGQKQGTFLTPEGGKNIAQAKKMCSPPTWKNNRGGTPTGGGWFEEGTETRRRKVRNKASEVINNWWGRRKGVDG